MTNKTKLILIAAGASLIYLATREQRKKQPTIYYVQKLPLGFNAVTLPPFGIYIRAEHEGNQELLAHEMIHWQQYQRMGMVPYYYEYMKGYMIHGYDLHPMEQEARENEDNFCQVNYTECVRNGKARTVRNQNFRRI